MAKTTVVAITLLFYKLLLIGIGFWASSCNKDEADFFLGGRALGPVVAAISYSSSASSAWTLLGLSGAAYVMGLSALWVAVGSCIGMLVAWYWVAPRLMDHTRRKNQLTVTDFLADDSSGLQRKAIVLTSSVIIIFSFTFYVAAQFQGAGNTFVSSFGLSMPTSIVLGALIITIYTLLVRFMALRDRKALRQARIITMVWYGVVFGGMVLLGLIGHVLHPGIDNPETIFFTLTDRLFTPVVGAILLAAVLSAIMSTADSQLLVAASAIAHDLGLGKKHAQRSLLVSRLTIVGLVVFAVMVALYLPEKIFSRVLFAWVALGAAFGPTLFLRLAQVPLKPVGILLSILTGFGLAVVFYLMPDSTGDIFERLLPFCASFAMLLLFRQRS